MYMAVCDNVSQIGPGDFTLGSYNLLPFSRKCPITMGHACSSNYWPFNASAYDYLGNGSTTNNAQLSVLMHGCDSAATLEVSVIVNWELIPNISSAGSIAVRPSRCDFKALEIAANALGSDKMFATFEQDVFRLQNSLSAGTENPENDGVLARIASWIKQSDPETARKGFSGAFSMYDWYNRFSGSSMGMSGAGLLALQN